MSINNDFFDNNVLDNSDFENSYYFPPVFSSCNECSRSSNSSARAVSNPLEVNPNTSQDENSTFNKEYIQGYLRTLIGKSVRVEFLVGTNVFVDKSGVLETVGVNYIVLRGTSNETIMCDLYSIKFVTGASSR